MPPKKPAVKTSTTAKKKVPQKSTTSGSKSTGNKPLKKTSPTKSSSKTNAVLGKGQNEKTTKKKLSKEDLAARKIQSIVRSYLAKCQLKKLKQQKIEYDDLIEKLQKQAWLDMIQKQREEDEKQRLKEEEERKRRREELKWRKDFLDAAFDGELEDIKNILKKADEQIRKASKLTGDSLENFLQRYMMTLIECTDANENSALSEASAGGDTATIQYLLDNGAFINSLGQFHRTPIYRAAFGGHLEAVKLLLENGGDPRIQDNDGVSPAEIAANPSITEYLTTWDVSRTEEILEKVESERTKRQEEEKKYRKKEQDRIRKNLDESEKEYKTKQKLLQKAYEELNKRIYEHDMCTAQHPSKTDLTLKAIQAAEELLLDTQREEQKCREQIMALRSEFRDQATNDESDDDCVKCNLKELDEVLMRDVGDKIKNSGKWPLLIDCGGQAVTFLRYRDTNYLNALNPKNMESDTIRLALLGAIRYGKSLVFDMMDVDMLEFISERMDGIEKGLYAAILDKSILKNEKYLSLLRDGDNPEYAKDKFTSLRMERFSLVIVTKRYPVPDSWKEIYYAIKIVTPAMAS